MRIWKPQMSTISTILFVLQWQLSQSWSNANTFISSPALEAASTVWREMKRKGTATLWNGFSRLSLRHPFRNFIVQLCSIVQSLTYSNAHFFNHSIIQLFNGPIIQIFFLNSSWVNKFHVCTLFNFYKCPKKKTLLLQLKYTPLYASSLQVRA